ncbi:helix-hairpin-helix domain-containing protein [Halosquirtibacter xylanolyticus]|uniref:helix-hairpin-helix domain-containing protein n=1 Tax=Halosquirtibacter xylanolyticus TaxID=3374599 RepID=UPI003749325B|nr:helix-hairpin-helix domain-containing protein [Prolixibacteraceae bacterium]
MSAQKRSLISYFSIILLGGVIVCCRYVYVGHKEIALVKKLDIPNTIIDSLRWSSVSCFQFDPNNITEDSLELLGFDSSLISRIEKYRRAKGRFRDVNQFISFCNKGSIWAEHFRGLVVLTEDNPIKRVDFNRIVYADYSKLLTKSNADEMIRIYRYRSRYGGFVSWEQLKDLCCVSDKTLSYCRKLFFLDSNDIIPIDVNVASYESLRKLPYLNSTDVVSVMNYREKNMGFGSYAEFISTLTISEVHKSYLVHYVSF